MFEGGVIGGRVGVDEPGFLGMIDGDGDGVVDFWDYWYSDGVIMSEEEL